MSTIYGDSIGVLILNVGLMGAGGLFGILGILMGISRGMSKNSDTWAITFASFAWLIALFTPNTPWAISVFVAGAVALTTVFSSMMPKINENNIFIIATVAGVLSIIMLVGSGAFSKSINWNNNMASAENDINNLLGTEAGKYNSYTPNHGLCAPGDAACQQQVKQDNYNPAFFDVIASVLAIGRYVAIAVIFAGLAVLAPFAMTTIILSKVTNPIVALLIGIYVNMYNFIIAYHIIRFVLSKNRV